MFFFFVLSQVCGRSYDLLSSGGAAGLLLLLESPFRCLDAGFLVSMGAVMAAGIYREVLPAGNRKLSGTDRSGDLSSVSWSRSL